MQADIGLNCLSRTAAREGNPRSKAGERMTCLDCLELRGLDTSPHRVGQVYFNSTDCYRLQYTITNVTQEKSEKRGNITKRLVDARLWGKMGVGVPWGWWGGIRINKTQCSFSQHKAYLYYYFTNKQKTHQTYTSTFISVSTKKKKGHKQTKQSAVSVHSVHYRKSETWCDIQLVLSEFL